MKANMPRRSNVELPKKPKSCSSQEISEVLDEKGTPSPAKKK